MATPGRTPATSLRVTAKAPTSPVAIATTNSMRPGETRPVICELLSAHCSLGMTGRARVITTPISTTAMMETPTTSIDRPTCRGSTIDTPNPTARIGVARGATIIAPITVAVESTSTPPVAMIPDRTSSTP